MSCQTECLSFFYRPQIRYHENEWASPRRHYGGGWWLAQMRDKPKIGLGQPDDLVGKRERRAREGYQAGFESHADWNPGINPVPSYSLVGYQIGRPMVSEVLH